MVAPQRVNEHGQDELRARKTAATDGLPTIDRKEADKLITPDLPNAVGLRAWTAEVVMAINTASARTDTAFVLDWINVAFDPGLEIGELKTCPASLQSMDGKL